MKSIVYGSLCMLLVHPSTSVAQQHGRLKQETSEQLSSMLSKEAFDALNQGDIYFYGLFDFEKNYQQARACYEKAASEHATQEVRSLAKQRIAELEAELPYVPLTENIRARSGDSEIRAQ